MILMYFGQIVQNIKQIKFMKKYLYNLAKKSPIRKWALSLTGWKWLAWQLVVGGVFFIILEIILNLIGMTMIPWK